MWKRRLEREDAVIEHLRVPLQSRYFRHASRAESGELQMIALIAAVRGELRQSPDANRPRYRGCSRIPNHSRRLQWLALALGTPVGAVSHL